MAEPGCLHDAHFQNLEVSGNINVTGTLTHKRPIYSSVAQTAEKTLTVDDSGTLLILGSTANTTQIINLPTISTSNEVGTYFDFIVTVIGTSGATGSYTINTGGHTSDLSATPEKGRDDFIGTLNVVDTTLVVAADKTIVIPVNGNGIITLADNTNNGEIAKGTKFRCTAVAPSTTTDKTDVWLLSGTILTSDATDFVNTAIFS